ncbi:hypothetical protein D9615_005671 [Tricholomella constricta]|uniref:Cytochrome P450 n=1 Tax=Tricholomella constricta TaxID=117010 RepID=A0A8H5HAZ0_9AGAR|nr:hypothetical protein D9615_005671 [Tricholomella constricta]
MDIASMSYQNTLLSIAGAGLLTHLIFKRTETHEPSHLAALLLGFPAALTPLVMHHSSSILGAGSTTFLTFWATLGASIITYRLSPWHPLAKYPGPLICKASKLWLAVLSLHGKQFTYYAKLHEQYGDVVRIGKSGLSSILPSVTRLTSASCSTGPNELSIRDVAAVAPMMGPQGFPKGPFWDGRIPEAQTVKPMIALRDKTEHTRRRRPWTRAFSTAALKGYEDIITTRCVELVETLAHQEGTVDMAQWISFFAYDLMNDLAFGGGTEMMRDGDVDGLWHLMEAGQKSAIFMSHVPWLGALFLRFPKFANDLKAFREHAKKCVMARLLRGSPHKDLFHHLIDEDGVAANLPTIFEVISDGGVSFYAARSSKLLKQITRLRLQAEIDELGDDAMDYAKQAHLTYLNSAMCVPHSQPTLSYNPTLSPASTQKRKHASVPAGPERQPALRRRRKNHRAPALLACLYTSYVPKGTSTFIPFFSLHRDPRCFSPLPDAFLPERWLPPAQQAELEPGLFTDTEQENSTVVLNANAFIPFSVGPSNCVGKNLAWMEMRMLVCRLVQAFEMRFGEGYDPGRWEEDMLDYFVTIKGRLPVVLTPRK